MSYRELRKTLEVVKNHLKNNTLSNDSLAMLIEDSLTVITHPKDSVYIKLIKSFDDLTENPDYINNAVIEVKRTHVNKALVCHTNNLTYNDPDLESAFEVYADPEVLDIFQVIAEKISNVQGPAHIPLTETKQEEVEEEISAS